MKSKKQLHEITLQKGLSPIKQITVSEWADKYRKLPTESAEPGRWRTSRVPYMKEVMDAFTQQGINRIVVKSAAQCGKSETLLNVIGRYSQVDPASILLIQPTLEMAADFSKSRLTKMIEETKALRTIFYRQEETAKSRNSNQTILSKFYEGGRIVLGGANSAAGLSSRPIRILLCDEVDRFPISAGNGEGEGDPVSLAAKRTTTYWNRKIGLFSTPTNEGLSRIDKEYETGSQEEWSHKCPGCGEYHSLDNEQMDVDYQEKRDENESKKIIVKEVKWRCPDCGFSFDELTMKKAEQKYIVKNAEGAKNGIRSFFISGFSSTWVSWKEIMTEWLEAEGNPELEKVVYNTRFGKSYKLVGAYANEKEFIERREEYGAEIPEGVLFLTAAVDVQDNRLEGEICGWNEEEECYGIWKFVINGKPNDEYVWRELDKILDRGYKTANNTILKVTRTFIDSGGHYTSEVYEYSRKNIYKQRIAIKGYGGAGIPLLYKVSALKRYGIPLQILGVNEGKQEVFSRLGKKEKGAQYFHYPKNDEYIGLRGYDDIYFKQIIAEHKVIRQIGGMIKAIWEPVSKGVRNEALDLRVYNIAAYESCKPDIKWEELRGYVRGEKEMEENKREKKAAKKNKEKVKSVSIGWW